jgi:hypothetical protein
VAERAIVRVDGLREFQRALAKMDKDKAKALRLALNESAQFLIDEAKPNIPRDKGAAADSLRARSTQKAVRIAAGGSRAPYFPWLDFGGAVGRNKATKRPFYKEGRYLYVTLRERREDFTRILEGALTGLVRDAGLEVTHG